MAYKVIILYRLYMPSYFLGTFTEYPFLCTCPKKKGLQHIQETEFRHEPQALVI